MWRPLLLALVCCSAVVNAQRLQQGNKVLELDTTYNVLIRVGDSRPNPVSGQSVTLGAILDKTGNPLLGTNGAPRFTNNPDFTSYLQSPDRSRLTSVLQMEDSPAAFYAMGLEQRDDGHLRVNTLQPVDFSQWDGSIRPCAGSVSPWGTHIGGEENCPDVKGLTTLLTTNNIASVATNSGVRDILNWHGYYLGNPAIPATGVPVAPGYINYPNNPAGQAEWFKLFQNVFKPYMLGHAFEINVDGPQPIFKKHMALGRSSFEEALIMPDRQTVYLTDDSSAGGLLKFVADKREDLSKGTLWAAKFTQVNADNSPSGRFTIEWVWMSYMDHDIILSAARQPLTTLNFGTIFTVGTPTGSSCPTGFRRIDFETIFECLQLNTATPNVEMLAAGLETRRYISYVGATTEFSKMEGITFDERRNKLFMSISFQRQKNMGAGLPAGGADHVRVEDNQCGCTYVMEVDNQYSALNMMAQVCGVVQGFTPLGVQCALEKPQNPDNLSMMKGYPWLAISEDSGRVTKFSTDPTVTAQDLFWMHNVDNGQSIVIGAAEGGGAEVTAGLVTEIHTKSNKYTYITANYQGGSPRTTYPAPVGYIGPFDLTGSKDVTWKTHAPKGGEYKNPYGPFAV